MSDVDEILTMEHVTVTLGDEVETPVVDDVTISVRRGECLGLVGESGSGKSLLLRSILDMIPPPLEMTGSVRWRRAGGEPLLDMDRKAARGRDVSMIFQEPMRSLNPARRIEWTMAEPLRKRRGLRGRALKENILALLEDVGISDPHRVARAYPHELSGGLQQRVMIAAALSTEPQLLLCDEPTTALDVTTQAKIIELLQSLQASRGLSFVFVSHDLAVISEIADRVAVLYAGRLMEVGSTDEVIHDPWNSYTRMLVGSIPGQRSLAPEPDRAEGAS